MPSRRTKSRYRRIVVDRSTALLSRIFRLPSTSTVTFLLGIGASIWVIVGYAGLKIKENALRAASERRRNDRVKTHFQATLSNISFTVYALLPTLSTQLLSHLNVEALTDELKGIAAASAAESSKPPRMTDSGMASWAASSESDVTSKSLESSAVLSSNEGERETEDSPASKANDTTTGLGIHTGSQGQAQSSSSWVQEFNTTQSTVSTAMESDMSDMGATSAGEEGPMTSTESHSISLPPTSPSSSSISPFSHQEADEKPTTPAAQPSLNPPDHAESVSSPVPASTVSISGSNASFTDQSSESGSSPPYLHSPPGSPSVSPFRRPRRVDQQVPVKTEEHSVLKNESHTASEEERAEAKESAEKPAEPRKTKAQLWNEIKIKSEHHGISPLSDEDGEGDDDDVSNISASISPTSTTFGRLMKAKEAIVRPWSYFSLQEMGLQDISQDDGQSGPGGITGLMGSIWTELTSTIAGSSASDVPVAEPSQTQEPLHARLDSETERLFLCMSWWFLHVGWRILEAEAAKAVEETCQTLPLKKEMTLDDWNDTLTNIRKKMDESLSSSKLLHILLPPPSQAEFDGLMEQYPTESACPFAAPPYSPILTELLDQTAAHLTSIDFIYVFSHSILLVQGALLSRIASEIYKQDNFGQYAANQAQASVQELESKKLVQCLPTLTRWSQSVWHAIPDEAIDVSVLEQSRGRLIG
ncbi:hypothetical protein QFC20_002229 [Naganishia adeliensis]|uniref:Uncharacterized protein n=1 Tax=Naganishia adeliensis TaxID=92952 RepID=A0ACC2WMX1_9TREE|nr:hypothetical protein QFC20_002229 [Naganishia adeliensis]